MTIEERKERFYNFHGCTATVCDDCVYHGGRGLCADRITEDARAIMKDMEDKHLGDEIKTIVEDNRPPVFEAPLTTSDRGLILEIIRLKTEVPDLSAHLIQEINEFCTELNWLAASIGKMEQIEKGTDPVGKDESEGELLNTINIIIDTAIAEAADVYNYLWAIGYSDKLERFRENVDHKLERFRENVDHKLARWANRLNGVSDE